MVRYKIIIPVVIGSILIIAPIFFIYIYPNLLILVKYHSITITGTIDYPGVPESEGIPVHGHVRLIPEQDEIGKLGETGVGQVVLIGSNLRPELDGKLARIQGTFIDDYLEYLSETFWPRSSGDPGGPVIMVKDIEIQNSKALHDEPDSETQEKQPKVSASMKQKDKISMLSVKNFSDEPIFKMVVRITDSKIKFGKANGWKTIPADENKVLLETFDRPVVYGKSLRIMLITDHPISSLEWFGSDKEYRQISSGMLRFSPVEQQWESTCSKHIDPDPGSKNHDPDSFNCVDKSIKNCELQTTRISYRLGPVVLSMDRKESGKCFISISEYDWGDYGMRGRDCEVPMSIVQNWTSWKNPEGPEATKDIPYDYCYATPVEITVDQLP